MDMRKLKKGSVQFDYFSENYNQFRGDFYNYSNLVIPLPFLAESILFTMSESQVSYFRLPYSKAKDHRNHFFIFKVRMQKENNQIRTYEYLGHSFDKK